MNKFKLIARYPEYADFTELDIADDTNITLNYQIEDILDITKRNTSYSKTITLPGTPINNQFFKFVFDVNVNNITFNPSKRVPIFVTVTDNQVFSGDLQLLNIKLFNKEVQYEVVLTGKLRDIITEMSDFSLKDLDLSEYNHTRNADNIKDSWEYRVFINGQLTNVGGPGTGYVYPLIRREVGVGIANNFVTRDYDYFPAVYVKTIIDKLFEFNNYTYSSQFFNSEYFKKLIIPYAEDKFEVDEEDFNDKMLYVGVDTTGGESADVPTNTGYLALTGVFFRNGVWYNNGDFNSDFNLNRETGTSLGLGSGPITEAPFQFQDNYNQWGRFNGWLCDESGYYDINLKVKTYPKWFVFFDCPIRYNGAGQFYFRYGIGRVLANSPTVYSTITDSGVLPFSPSDNLQHESPWYDTATPLLLDAVAENIYLNVGDRIVIWYQAVYPVLDQDFNTTLWAAGTPCFTNVDSSDVRMRIVMDPVYDGQQPSRLKISKTTSQTYGQETEFMNAVLPNIKQKDFFLDIVKMFNLVIVDDPIVNNNLIIEPRDDYYASKQKVLNWEDEKKLDYDSEIKITPMSELDANTYLFTYSEDDDWLNEEYTDETREIWSELEISVDNDFSVKTNTTKLLFAPTPVSNHLYSSAYPNYVMPYFTSYDGILYEPKIVKPRILFYNGLTAPQLPTDFTGLQLTLIDTFNNTASNYFNFPYCGMWDNPTNPQFDLGFGRTQKLYWDTQQFPTQNLYEKFHKATINNIIDTNAKLFEGYFHLTPKDIAQFDFRDIVFLQGQYWRVNKIKDYNPIGSDELTPVELYRISDVKTFERERVEITTSNDQCPIDIVARRLKGGYFYVSLSGQEISAGCCKQINGQYINGQCRLTNIPIGPVVPTKPNVGPVIPGVVQPIKWRSGGPYITPISQKSGPSSSNSLGNSKNSPGIILGRENLIPINSGASLIIGDGNTISPNVDNIIVIGNGIYADTSGALYFDNGYYNNQGNFIKTNYYIIEGGEDEVFEVMKKNLIDVVDGTVDAIRNFGGDSKERPVIDGNITLSINESQIPPELP